MLAKTPPMGFNTWNTFGEKIDETVIRETADAMVSLGLRDAGYEYLVIDDCWSLRDRDPATGRIVPDPVKFPSGMKALADYVHSKGLKFGMYSCAGVRTCGNYPGSFDHEYLDAQTFAEWGVDYLKYDFCYVPEGAYGPLLYRRMGHALRCSGREIMFSACQWGCDNVWSWIRSTGAHLYRSTGDINDSFASIRHVSKRMIPGAPRIDLGKDGLYETLMADGGSASNSPGCFNDIDMLVVGMFGKGNVANAGCNEEDYKTHFALWCFLGVPLMLGADLRNFAKDDPKYKAMLDLVTNKELLALDQDEECRPACNVDWNTRERDQHVLSRLLSNGDVAIGFFNMADDARGMTCFMENVGFPASCGLGLRMRDIFTGEDLGVKREILTLSVPAHGCRIFRCTPERV